TLAPRPPPSSRSGVPLRSYYEPDKGNKATTRPTDLGAGASGGYYRYHRRRAVISGTLTVSRTLEPTTSDLGANHSRSDGLGAGRKPNDLVDVHLEAARPDKGEPVGVDRDTRPLGGVARETVHGRQRRQIRFVSIPVARLYRHARVRGRCDGADQRSGATQGISFPATAAAHASASSACRS